jgi:hypothetical protein
MKQPGSATWRRAGLFQEQHQTPEAEKSANNLAF